MDRLTNTIVEQKSPVVLQPVVTGRSGLKVPGLIRSGEILLGTFFQSLLPSGNDEGTRDGTGRPAECRCLPQRFKGALNTAQSWMSVIVNAQAVAASCQKNLRTLAEGEKTSGLQVQAHRYAHRLDRESNGTLEM